MKFIPANQARLIELIDQACKNRLLIGVKAERGFGITYTIESYVKAFPHNKIVLADVKLAPHFKGVVIGLFKSALNVRFSNLQHTQATLHDLTLILINRMKKDLKDKNLLIVLDNIQHLRPLQHIYLLKFLKHLKVTMPCGIIIRGNQAMFNTLAIENPNVNDDYFIVADDWKTFKPYTLEEIEMFVKSCGISDEFIIADISKKTTSLTVAKKLIDNHFKKRGK